MPVLLPGYSIEPAAMPSGCVWTPGSGWNNACGQDFSPVDLSGAKPPTEVGYGAVFREAGVIAQDVNGDGWEDVTLIYHAQTVSISIRPGTTPFIRRTVFNVGGSAVPPAIHSGRSYGIWTARGTTSGTYIAVVLGGVPSGTFRYAIRRFCFDDKICTFFTNFNFFFWKRKKSDHNCNVSRFVAKIGALGLMATRYLGFASTVWSAYDVNMCGATGASCLKRPGDFENNCMHHFGNGRVTTSDGVELISYNYFAGTGGNMCYAEQYALYQPPTFSAAKQATWTACYSARHAAATGKWGQAFIRFDNWQGYTGAQTTYVHALHNALLGSDSGPQTYLLVESVGAGNQPFDLTTIDAEPTIQVMFINAQKLYESVGAFPVPGRPKIRYVNAADTAELLKLFPHDRIGAGSFTNVAVLHERRCEGDDAPAILLTTDEWVGWNVESDAFEVRPKVCPEAAQATTVSVESTTLVTLDDKPTLVLPTPSMSMATNVDATPNNATVIVTGSPKSTAKISTVKTQNVNSASATNSPPQVDSAASMFLSSSTLFFWVFPFVLETKIL